MTANLKMVAPKNLKAHVRSKGKRLRRTKVRVGVLTEFGDGRKEPGINSGLDIGTS
jgi:hypothetical protein